MGAVLVLALLGQFDEDSFDGPILFSNRSSAPALFEFAPTSGVGMTAACACSNPTGSKGEALTFTRSSSAYCTKSNVSTGIANGDLVLCSTDQPRIMPGGDGTGALGLLMEQTNINQVLRSASIDNAAWTKGAGGGLSAPTVTADYGVAPDGTTTADRVVGTACPTPVTYNDIEQGSLGASRTVSVYLKGVSASGTVTLFGTNGVGDSTIVVCNYVSTSWTRCSLTRSGASSGTVGLGCFNTNAVLGGTDTGAYDVLVWGFQAEPQTYASSYIPTTSAATTRASDLAYFALTPPSPTISLAATRVGTTAAVINTSLNQRSRIFALTQTGGTFGFGFYFNNVSTNLNALLGATNPKVQIAASLTGVDRAWQSFDGTTTTLSLNGTTNTATGGTLVSGTHLTIGYDESTNLTQAEGVISRVCMDPSPTRCR